MAKIHWLVTWFFCPLNYSSRGRLLNPAFVEIELLLLISMLAIRTKIWEAELSGNDVTVHCGCIGTQGQTKTKAFATTVEAQREYESLIAEKTKISGDQSAHTGRNVETVTFV